MIFPYNLLQIVGGFATLPFLPVVLLSEKRRKTMFRRLGISRLPKDYRRKGKRPFWIHALSVGETLSAGPLMKELRRRFPNETIVFSVSTKTGFEVAEAELAEIADELFFFPYDLLFSVKRIVKRINPAISVIVETDIWPNFLFEMKKRKTPVLLVNARLSNRSFRGYGRFSFFMKHPLSVFRKVCVQSLEDARKFESLGVSAEAISKTGNMKFDQPDDPFPQEEIEALRKKLNIETDRKIVLAGSTHKGEESIICESFSRLKRLHKNLSLVAVPRDPGRAGAVDRIFRASGFTTCLYTQLHNSERGNGVDVVIVDVIGILKKLYAIADIAFVGGSLVDFGGHNPLEPAMFSKPVLFGPYMSDFSLIAKLLLKSGGAIRVSDAEDLHEALETMLSDKKTVAKTGAGAFGVVSANRGAVDKTMREIAAIAKNEM